MSWTDTITSGQTSYIVSLCADVDAATVPEDLDTYDRKRASNTIEVLQNLKAQQVTAAPKEVTEEIVPVVAGGYYTVVRPSGEHRTFRVKEAGANSKLAGKWIISILSGPDNTSNYDGVGFVGENGVNLWRRFSGNAELQADVDALVADDPLHAGKRYAMQSGNCYVCARLLTDPESIEAGIGPVCREG